MGPAETLRVGGEDCNYPNDDDDDNDNDDDNDDEVAVPLENNGQAQELRMWCSI